MNLHRDSDGKLAKFAWPGGYPVVYYFADHGECCPDCANGDNGSEASTDPSTDEQWRIVACDVIEEETDMEIQCAHCSRWLVGGNWKSGPELAEG